MAKYRFLVQETVFHTFELEIPDDIQEDDLDDYFYNLEEEDQKAGLVDSESFSWEIDEIEKV